MCIDIVGKNLFIANDLVIAFCRIDQFSAGNISHVIVAIGRHLPPPPGPVLAPILTPKVSDININKSLIQKYIVIDLFSFYIRRGT